MWLKTKNQIIHCDILKDEEKNEQITSNDFFPPEIDMWHFVKVTLQLQISSL